MNRETAENEVILFKAQKEPAWIALMAILGCSIAVIFLAFHLSRPWHIGMWAVEAALCGIVAYWLLYFRAAPWTAMIDTDAGFVRVRRRILGFIVRQETMALDEVEFVTVHPETGSWFGWLRDIFRPAHEDVSGFGYELAMSSGQGDSIVLETYPDASDALQDAERVCEQWNLPLQDSTTGRLRETSSDGRLTPYAHQLAQRPESAFGLSARPARTIADYDYDGSNLSVHIPRQWPAWWKLPGALAFMLAITAVGGAAFGAYESRTKMLIVAAISLGACVWMLWEAIKCRCYEAWLSVSPRRISVTIRDRKSTRELDMPIDDLRSVWLSDNVGLLNGAGLECVFLGREALEISAQHAKRPFGLGMSDDELAWLQQLIDWTISDRPGSELITSLNGPTAVASPVASDEAPRDRQDAPAVCFGASSLTRSTYADTTQIGVWLVLIVLMLGGIGVTVRPDLAVAAEPDTARTAAEAERRQMNKENEEMRENFEKIKRFTNSPEYKRAMEEHRQRQRGAQSQPAD